MFIFFPYRVDVFLERNPYTNILLILLTIFFFFASAVSFPEDMYSSWVLDGWTVSGLFGHLFLHADLWHLLGNMMYLWLFGTPICSKIGNIFYVLLYLFSGLAAAVAHNVLEGGTAVGASGAINGVIGFYLWTLYPTHKISFFRRLLPRVTGIWYLSGYWMIVLWVAWETWDIYGTYSGGTYFSFYSSLGGFVAGALLGYCLKVTGVVKITEHIHIRDVPIFPLIVLSVPLLLLMFWVA